MRRVIKRMDADVLVVQEMGARPYLDELQREGLAVLAQAVMRRLNSHRADIRARFAIAEREERLRRMIEGVRLGL